MAFPPYTPRRAATIGRCDPQATALVNRLLRLATTGLPLMYDATTDEFAFTRTLRESDSDPGLELRGTSLRYAAIVALGAHWLAEPQQRQVLGGRSANEFVTVLVERLRDTTNLGDAALVCWAAAQSEHPRLAQALARLRQLDSLTGPAYVVEAAWVVSALATARAATDVESHLAGARERLLNSVLPGSPVFPHTTGPGLVRSYRKHVTCFADQVYPIQALARLHRSGDDGAALAAARLCAAHICLRQGPAGQWWWHYDARTGDVIEGYPVYTVHQHAMAPMALLDLADAGGADHTGTDYTAAIHRGLTWITAPAELGPRAPSLILDDEGVTWRKVYRGDPRKFVRGLHTLTTRAAPGLRVPGVGRVFRPRTIDRECRPYEFGWLLFTWLGGIDASATSSADDLGTAPTGSAR